MYHFKLFVFDGSLGAGEQNEDVHMRAEKTVNTWLAEHPTISIEKAQTVVGSSILCITLFYALPPPG
mgnify:CR=1 FL=1